MEIIHIPTSIWWLLGGTLVFLAVVLITVELFFPKPERRKYEYLRKHFLMSEREARCFFILERAVGTRFYIFPQIHFDALLNHKVNGQNWNGARRHIDEKSVDFVLCAKSDLSVVLAIELDDSTHERPDRWRRDREQERMFVEAGLPLLRLPYSFNEETLSAQIDDKINNFPKAQTTY